MKLYDELFFLFIEILTCNPVGTRTKKSSRKASSWDNHKDHNYSFVELTGEHLSETSSFKTKCLFKKRHFVSLGPNRQI